LATIPFNEDSLIEWEGEFPDVAAFERLERALWDVAEFGLELTRDGIARAFATRYEAEAGDGFPPITYEQAGVIAAHAAYLRETVGRLDAVVGDLEKLASDALDYATTAGRAEREPSVGDGGGQYRPSKDVAERWGLTGLIATRP
jgi:hypothetical protein